MSNSLQKPAENIGIYTIGPEIGRGSFATVYKCVDNKTHRSVAIKSVVRSKLKSKKLVENLEIEISILKSMKHPHIVGLLDYKQTTSHFHLVMDYCSMGDLSYFIRKRNQLIKTHPVISSLLERYPSPEGSHGLNETLVVHFLKQLSSALSFLRDKSLVHRDIKPQNLLLCPPVHTKQQFIDGDYVGLWELPILKIADFGFARFLPSTSMAETLCGSPLYMAPEILRYEKYNAKADLWSVGAVLYEMTVGKPPFKAGNHIELLKNIERANDRIKFPSAAQVPEELKRLIRSLLKYNPTERVSFNEFFSDALIIGDLEGNDRPLETSSMDENLFISEYISPIKPSQRSQLIQPITPVMTPNDESNRNNSSSPEPTHESNNNTARVIPYTSASSNSRDEEIKQIINKNSPGPETLSHSISGNKPSKGNKSVVIRNKDDIILEKDYVVVEKRAIEVNAIADELAHAGSGAVAINPRRSSSGSTTNDYSKAVRYRRASSGSSQRRPSFTDRRISISISPTNALSKAIGLASNRLWGKSEYSSTNNTFSTVISSPNFANHLLLQKINLPTSATVTNAAHLNSIQNTHMTSDEKVLNTLESLATKAHAVNLFADVKFSQLIPSPPSSDGLDDDLLHQNDMLPPKIIKSISEEGVVLYVKTLSLLAKGMAIASEWWYSQNEGNDGEENIRRSSHLQNSVRINELVQWIREKFNESLEKAEFIRLRLEEANASISREEEEQNVSPNSSTSSTRIIAEKMIFDRALEMSRNAAVNELVKEDLKGCELAYSTAIWMLEALLDDDAPANPEDSEQRLDNEDRAMVEKFIVSIGNRLSVLKKKLELM
ncbi:Serine/threonine-protein kinase ATG1 [Scheffersomyces xylosifermentans]|uniref:Serine/threonine-protein kinase ATG1 n=1 Tax=Scheffersomyces xylosifermentans TaxID=1304137 RepID=UPI00315D87B4